MTRPEHYRSYSAVFPILLREGANGREVLLHLRQNTGYMDGHWDFAGSGHVDTFNTYRFVMELHFVSTLDLST